MTTKRNGRPYGNLNQLRPASRDTIELFRAVEERFVRLLNTWERIRGERLVPPSSLDREMLLWRTMAIRFKKGDFRHTAGEFKAMTIVAQWTVDTNKVLRGQPLEKPIEWEMK